MSGWTKRGRRKKRVRQPTKTDKIQSTLEELTDLIVELQKKYGDSSTESRTAVIDAHGGLGKMRVMAGVWAEHHGVSSPDVFVAYATAVELGYRMAMAVKK